MARFAEVEALKSRLDAHRPIPPAIFATIRQKLHIDWTYHSTRIEGGPLSYQETAFFVRTGQTVKGRPLEAYLEYRGHEAALDYLEQLVHEQQPLSEALIKELHALLLRGIDWIMMPDERGQPVRKPLHPGSYKYENNRVVKLDGSIHTYCDHLQVPGEMERLIAWYHEQRQHLHPIELAAAAHHQLTAIHPFTDGNGRVARLVMNLILMQAGYVPAVIRDEERQDYLAALEAADAGDPLPLITMIEREVSRTLQLMLDVIEGRTALNEEDLGRRFETFSRRMEALREDYQRDAVIRAEQERRDVERNELRSSCIREIGQYLATKFELLPEKYQNSWPDYTLELSPSYYAEGSKNSTLQEATKYRGIAPKTIRAYYALRLQFVPQKRPLISEELFLFVVGCQDSISVFPHILSRESEKNRIHEDKDSESLVLEGSINFTEWDKAELDEFFVRSADTFLNAIEREAERRRRDALEGTQPGEAPDVGADA